MVGIQCNCHGFSCEEYPDNCFSHFSLILYNGGTSGIAMALAKMSIQGPVVQSVVSLMSSLRVILLTVLADSMYNTLIFFAEKT